MTTCPLAESYVDQQLIIALLDATLPKDVAIVVKEHPFQRSQGRIAQFYDELASYERVVILSKNISSHKLIEGATAIATCTGTAGWEALWAQKPVLMFGEKFYSHAPGVYDARSLESCKNAVNAIFSGNPPRWTGDDLAKYVEATEKITQAGFTDVAYEGQSSVRRGDNSENIRKILFEKLRIETNT
jgi:capsule polysaccharide modification protein KpsS